MYANRRGYAASFAMGTSSGRVRNSGSSRFETNKADKYNSMATKVIFVWYMGISLLEHIRYYSTRESLLFICPGCSDRWYALFYWDLKIYGFILTHNDSFLVLLLDPIYTYLDFYKHALGAATMSVYTSPIFSPPRRLSGSKAKQEVLRCQ